MKTRLFEPAILFLCLLLLTGAAAAQKTRQLVQEENKTNEARTALVIGNGAYESSPLANPANDAADMADALKSLGFEVLSYTNLDQTAMKRAIREFGARLKTRGGIGLFYYAGHGVQTKGVNYLIPVSAKVASEEEVEYESVEVGFVMAQMEAAKNELNIVILDACRNNPFARSYRSAEQGLASVDAPSGTLVAYATAPGSVASDGKGRNGLYTEELLKAMKTEGLSIEEVFKRVRIAVRGATANRQTPWESSSLTGDFFFATAGTAPKPDVKPIVPDIKPVAGDDETTFWNSIRNSGSRADFDDYLRKYPNGAHAAEAKQRYQELYKREKDAQTAGPDTVSGGVVNGKATNLVKPEYPPAARMVKASGTVNVQVTIDTNGNVISATAVSGHPLLQAAAVNAARASKFSPTILKGRPVMVTGIIVYNFQP